MRAIKRTALKTGTYAIMHLVVAVMVAYALTQDWRAALAIGIVEPFVQTFAFAVHERIWAGRDRETIAAAARADVCQHTRLI